MEKSILELSNEIKKIKIEVNEKFTTAAKIFDHLKKKIDTIEKRTLLMKPKEDKIKDINISSNYILCQGKKYICNNYIKKKNCIIQNIIREAGFDICFDIDNTEKCENLIEIE